MTILLLGSTGQVGFELHRALAPLGRVIAPLRGQLNLGDADGLAGALRATRPELIVNAAAWTAVDAAETEREAAFDLNARLPEQLARYAAIAGIPLVHYSSDYVYPGDSEAPWREEDAAVPLSVYGESKLAGDEAIVSSGASHLIFRTSWVYSARGHNFMKTMLRLGAERDSLKVVEDQVGAPTPARLIAQMTVLALYRQRLGQPLSGVYHLVPRGETSWQGFAAEIFRVAQLLEMPLAITPEQVAGIPTTEYPTPARRPLNSRLDVTRLEKDLGLTLPDWQSQLALTLQEYRGLEAV